MANPGGVGAKFTSLNLNKSYGQPSHHNHNSAYSGSGSYGQAAAGRPRSFSGGGGMVVLSRTRNSQKVGPKLSIPPPLNLPSLRKEHERFDLSGSAGGSAGSGSGPRPTSAGMGWTKPAGFSMHNKSGSSDTLGRSGGDAPVDDGVDQSVDVVDGVSSRGSGVYVPPAAQLGGGVVSASARAYQLPVEKATVLRREDFPSLRAALPTTSAPVQKQNDAFHLKEKQGIVDEPLNELTESYQLKSEVHIHAQEQSSTQWTAGNGSYDACGEVYDLDRLRGSDKTWKKEEYFSGPLPLVRYNPRSDWADDERDTGHGFTKHNRDHGFTKTEAYWDTEFEMPRSSVKAHRPSNHNRRDQRDNGSGWNFSGESNKVDPSRRDARTPSREGLEGNMRRASFSRDGFHGKEAVSDQDRAVARSFGLIRDVNKENGSIAQPVTDNARDNSSITGNSSFGRRDIGHMSEGRQQWNNTMESSVSRGLERNSVFRTEQSSRYRFDGYKNGSVSKTSLSGGKDLHINDSVPGFGREKRAFKSDRVFGDDHFPKDFGSGDFDENDPFSGVVGIIKRKKEVTRQTAYHDPVRESFEAELERVQKMQEMERQRIIEEQERALEQARREEEERQQLIREEEERRRRQEEEAQEAAWRAEQERIEAIQRAEEQKLAREAEKKKVLMEEERRKLAAKQKLLELEARIAKRKTEYNLVAVAEDDKTVGTMKESDDFRMMNFDNWNDNERIVERVPVSASYDTHVLDKSLHLGSWPQSSREGSGFLDRGKPGKSWRKGVFDDGTSSSSILLQGQESIHYASRQDASAGGRSLQRTDIYGGVATVRSYCREGMPEAYSDEFSHVKGQRWNLSGEGDSDNLAEKYGDSGWGHGPSSGISGSPWPDQLYPNPEADELYSYGRSRYAMRQPRVLPPPSFASMHRAFRDESGRPGLTAFADNNMHYNHAARSDPNLTLEYYTGHEEKLELSNIGDVSQGIAMTEEQKVEKTSTPRCESQSSLSVSSPPNSPPHLSHDELDESGASLAIPSVPEGKGFPLSGNESVVLNEKSVNGTGIVTASSSVSGGEDDEWAVDNNEELQEQEVYDEDEDGYQDEAREAEDDLDVTQEFEHMHVQDGDSSGMIDNLVVGFNEGVKVGIPSDDFERNSRNGDNMYGLSNFPDGKEYHADELLGEVKAPQSVDSNSQMNVESSFGRIQGTEKSITDPVIKPISSPHSSTTSNTLDFVNVFGGADDTSQNAIQSSADVAACSSSQIVAQTATAFSNQADVPVKVHFGLFSGPSLIPSPIPAIQIGSIQMPLHLHPPVGPSLTHINPSQPPLFQFGQLRYASPISQGFLPMASQSMSFVQPNTHAPYNLIQNTGSLFPVQSPQESFTQNSVKNDVSSLEVNNQPGIVLRPLDFVKENLSRELTSALPNERAEMKSQVQNARNDNSQGADYKSVHKPSTQPQHEVYNEIVVNEFIAIKERRSESLSHVKEYSETVPYGKEYRRMKVQGPISSVKGKKVAYAVRNSSRMHDISHLESSGFQKRSKRAVQRTEFRVREHVDSRYPSNLVSSNDVHQDGKSNISGRGVTIFSRSGANRAPPLSGKPMMQMADLQGLSSVPVSSQEIGSRAVKESVKVTSTKSSDALLHHCKGNLKSNISEEDVDAPLQSGIVHVFKQPGIEAPSDEDDFIEVRSKRQMLNDRREQREKENKAKPRLSKVQRKPRFTTQNAIATSCSSKVSVALSGDASRRVHTNIVVSDVQIIGGKESSLGLNAMISQPLAPIGTPIVNVDSHTDLGFHVIKSRQTGSVISGGKDLGSSLIYETKDKVMALTQTQLDDAMKPGRFDTRVTSIGAHASSVEPILPSSSILSKGKVFSCGAASPISSLLAGEKIQFGALTSPTVLPSSSHAVLHGIGVPGPIRSDIQISHKLPSAENDCSLFFEKEKGRNESCVNVNLEDCEAEAEAAASAVAVAAISNDEVVGHGLGPISVSDGNSFVGADINRLSGGGAGHQSGQSKAEDSLSVSLPADLSVETPPISLWPTLSSPQNSSSQTLSPFPGARLSHFPFYEMNPMLGGPIFAFGPHDESSGSQSQSQKNSPSVTGPLATWQQCHSTMDSFYGPPAGFAGPYISPPAGIPGVQVPPHMVVYNHFAPVGQFGQVGLSFMGTTYIPSGKQPDWKHSPATSAMGIGEGEVNNLNLTPGQCNPSNISSPIQHIAPGSALLPMAPPLAMFDVSPFQAASDVSTQARWSHVPATALHSVPLSLPSHQLTEGLRPQFNHGHPVEQSMNLDRFSEAQNPSSSEKVQNFPVVTDATVTQIPDGLGLLDSSSCITSAASTHMAVNQASENAISDTGSSDIFPKSSSDIKIQSTSAFKSQPSQQKNLSAQHYGHSTGYNYQRNGVAQRSSSASEWSQRRLGFHGRNQSFGTEKGYPPTKVKQIYVAKQNPSVSAAPKTG